MSADGTAAVIRAYYDAWTSKDFDQAVALLGPGLTVEVPVNDYPDTESFATALRSFGSLATSAELLAAMSSGEEGMLLYDMDVPGLGRLRVAEHLTVKNGKITRLRQIHDTAAIRAAGFARPSQDTMAAPRERGQMDADRMPVGTESPAGGYSRRLVISAPRERVFDAIGTVDGPRHWWTTKVTGSAAVGRELRFGFAGLEEQMVMRVTICERPRLVQWSCLEHTRGDEWTGTVLRFELTACGGRECELSFWHGGLPSELVADGWEHFLGSLAAYAETGTGTPFGK